MHSTTTQTKGMHNLERFMGIPETSSMVSHVQSREFSVLPELSIEGGYIFYTALNKIVKGGWSAEKKEVHKNPKFDENFEVRR